ncbi:RHS repeat-associated core domain-containing protein [Dictyobacter arantiisoli]|uniref:DUF6443 domain-containing protein n=1 Tax=Dictyobacter arantiisoli TaxID=2014874 RepID=A0A5A5THJ8_9CHLR|nr:RHS repeat-associated core domain-containing protein [Dictyobacter arantiisoli]GCF10715.1 hypothetical protein KDI_42790 [Dictyobacter arantiisoli]
MVFQIFGTSLDALAAVLPNAKHVSSNPNPPLSLPAWLHTPKAVPHTLVGALSTHTNTNRPAVGKVVDSRVAAPVEFVLTSQAQTLVSKDGHVSVGIPANTVTAQQIKAAGGKISLKIVQTSSTSGGQASGRLIFGTYQLHLLDATEHPLTTLVLAHPLTLRYHLAPAQQSLLAKGQALDILWQNVSSTTTPTTPTSAASTTTSNASATPQASNSAPVLLRTAKDTGSLSWSISTSLQDPSTLSQKAPAKTTQGSSSVAGTATTPSVAAASTSIVTFNTQAPQASWGQAQNTDVGMSSGALDYQYPFSVPSGPGGLAPSLALNYGSGSVNETTNVQAAAPWTGEGWNLGLGSITWSQENVDPANREIQNIWTINDPSGVSGQLVPPDLGYTTAGTSPNPALSALPVTWHSAPESHDKIEEIQYGSQPCWQVWLPNGTMEEFGCTSDSRQSALDANNASSPYRWDLDAIVDRYGNQIRVHYQRIWPANGVQDAVISTIEYDDPSCHSVPSGTSPVAQCSSWNPLTKIVFDASTKVANPTNSDGCAGWSSTTFRCDDPVDASGGLTAPKVVNSYVLNDIKVETLGSVLREYVFSYDQGIHQQIQDPATGQQKGIAGYLNLTRIQTLGAATATGSGQTGSSSNAPVTTMTYTKQTEHYEDLSYYATPSTNCGPSWNKNNGCYLWSQTYNGYYLRTIDNGMGWNESVNWQEARNNTYGVYVPSGQTMDTFSPFSCDGQENNYPCDEADYRAWSRIVVTSRTTTTNGVASTWNYQYEMSKFINNATMCLTQSVCGQGFTWGDINDNDYADYYNVHFMSFASAQVTQPDQSYQQYTFYSTPGLGVATSSIQTKNCAYKFNNGTTNHCGIAPYWNGDPALAGRPKEVQSYSSDGKLMQDSQWIYSLNCPPSGVAGSVGAGTSGGMYDPGTSYLFSELDQTNPVVVCDPRVTQQDNYQVDGATDATHLTDSNTVHKTTTYSYDGDNQGSSHVSNYDYGNVNKVTVTANDVNSQQYISDTTYYPNDSSSVYLTDLPGRTTTQDSSGTQYGCHVNFYGGSSSFTTPPSLPDVTRTEDHTGYSNPTDGCVAPGSLIVNQATYDASGNATTAIDADNHLGCTSGSGSTTYSACAAYDGFDTHLVTVSNAKKQSSTNSYSASNTGGYGQWLLATKDANGQTTTFQYDGLGRLTAMAAPGDTLTSPTVSYTYNNTCTAGATAPCLEIDTTTRQSSGGSQTITTQQWYDGQGRLVETKAPGPNLLSKIPKVPSTLVSYTVYDSMGRATTKSLPYAVSALSGTGYVTPNLSQARTFTTYDGLGRSLGSVTYQDASTIVLTTTVSYQLGNGLASFSRDTTTPFERTITLDAYNHQQISYSDALGRHRYDQLFSGTGASGSPYSTVRTLQYNRDTVGNLYSTDTFDASSNIVAYQTTTYDGVGRKTGLNDADSGSCTNTPLPAGCSSSSDTAWKYNYDRNGNVLSQQDPRGQSTYVSYDVLNRALCKGTTSAAVSPCSSSAYATFFYDSYDNTSNPGVTFPSTCVAPSGSYASDPIGKETAETFSASAGNGSRCSGYNQRGQADQSGLTVTADGTTTTQTVSTSYNDMGQQTTLVYPDGEELTAQYDGNGYFRSSYFGDASSTDPVNFLVGMTTYTNNGQIDGLALGGSAAKASLPTAVFSTSATYDGIDRPVTSNATRNGSTFWSQTKTYDNVGNTLNLSTTLPTIAGGSQTISQSFCYDALNRLVWAGDTGTPTGGDHCGLNSNGTTIAPYQQTFSYDALDRLTSGPAGTETYGTAPVHGATMLNKVLNQYASYDAMGNMTCRNVDATTGSTHSCDATQSGALMSYDNEGRLASWTAPGASMPSDQFLYDNAGNRVLQRVSTGGSNPTDTITFDNYTEISINAGGTSTTKYYMSGGQKVAMRKDGILSYLVPDFLGSMSLSLYADGSVQAVQLFSPFGGTLYSDGSTPTSYNFTGQRLDSQTGLLYYNARYYDPISGRFISVDGVENNANGDDPYAYVSGNPETLTDPTGQFRMDGQGDRSWTSSGGNHATYVANDNTPPMVIGYGWGDSWTPVYGPIPLLTYPPVDLPPASPLFGNWWTSSVAGVTHANNGITGYVTAAASSAKKNAEIAGNVATNNGTYNDGNPGENDYIRRQAEETLGKSQSSTRNLSSRAQAAEDLGKGFEDAASKLDRVSNFLTGVGFFVDGISSGMADYNQHHDVGKAIGAGLMHGTLSTVGSMVFASQFSPACAIGGELIAGPPGAVVGAAVGAIGGGYYGGVFGDNLADDWCKGLNI